jgi:hypothetical protein
MPAFGIETGSEVTCLRTKRLEVYESEEIFICCRVPNIVQENPISTPGGLVRYERQISRGVTAKPIDCSRSGRSYRVHFDDYRLRQSSHFRIGLGEPWQTNK